mgnify:CR=1 FL=1
MLDSGEFAVCTEILIKNKIIELQPHYDLDCSVIFATDKED